MTIIDFIIIGIGLAADAVCASASNGINSAGIASAGKSRLGRGVFGALLFALFQGIMPVIGYAAGGLLALALPGEYAVAAVFLFLGGKMLWDSLCTLPEERTGRQLSLPVLLIQAGATSVDALAAGAGLRLAHASIKTAAPVISLVTFVLCLAAFLLGKKAGERFERHAGISGGILLIIMGLKSLCSALFFR